MEYEIVVNWQDDLNVRIECVPAESLTRRTRQIGPDVMETLASISTWAADPFKVTSK